MGKDFETHHDATVPATPDQVWDAIATGPGISTWFVGRTEIDDTTVRTAYGDHWIPTGTITTVEKPHHFAYRADTGPDGGFLAYEYLVEGNDHSATVLRTVTSGFLPGDDWTGEYEAMQCGTALFFATLAEHLTHFPGRTATPLTAFGPPVTDWPAAWKTLTGALGLNPEPQIGDTTTDGATVYLTNAQTLGLRTDQGFHRYIRGFHESAMIASHALYTPADPAPWTAFLHDLYTPES